MPRRAITIAAALIGLISLALGAHAALNMRSADPAAVVTAAPAVTKPPRLALVIGNSRYPDADEPLVQPVNDARVLSDALRKDGFDVDLVENATKTDMVEAVSRLKAKVGPGSVVMLYFSGFGIQARRESYMIPVNAAIWSESDVRREGTSIEGLLDAVQEQGAQARLVVLDASRRNPYERRFRSYSHGLAPLDLQHNALILASMAAGQVAEENAASNSLLVTELVKNLDPEGSVEQAFIKTRNAVKRVSSGAQVPVVSSSLTGEITFGAAASTPGARVDTKAGS